MIKNTKIQISSDVDYEHLIAEILVDKKTLFIVSKENNEFEVEIFLGDKIFSKKISLNQMIETLKLACEKLEKLGNPNP
jgi:hypothetical protein